MDIIDATRMVLGIDGAKTCRNCRFSGARYTKGPEYGSSWCYHPDCVKTPDADDYHMCSKAKGTHMILWEPKIDE